MPLCFQYADNLLFSVSVFVSGQYWQANMEETRTEEGFWIIQK